MHVDELEPARLPEMIPAVDQVFVTARGRTGSVAERWPALFRHGGARCFAIKAGGMPVAGLVARPVTCIRSGERFGAHQIGFVFTLPAWRGQGLASLLLQQVSERVAGPLVLWTTRPDFYARHGWEAWDQGGAKALWHGAATDTGTDTGTGTGTGTATTGLEPHLLPTLDAIRAASLSRRLERSPVDWLARPFGADHMRVAVEPGSYALFSQSQEAAILYEMVGDPARFDALWAAVACRCRSVLLNLDGDAAAAHWLRRVHGVTAQPNPLAMWLRWPVAERWSLDWLDRI